MNRKRLATPRFSFTVARGTIMNGTRSQDPHHRAPLPGEVEITGGFWGNRLAINRRDALIHQWEQLEKSGRLDNFRIVAGMKKGIRRGFFYDDSDVHKWAEAAALTLAARPDAEIEKLLAEYIELMRRARTPEGYLFTYNQFHFPGARWKNLQIEHELYTLGHLIEAGVSHHQATGEDSLLETVMAAADLVVREFDCAGPSKTPGHEEIEIALIRLHRLTGRREYLETARLFLENRGRMRLFGLRLILQFARQSRRAAAIRKRERALTGAAGGGGFDFTEQLGTREPPFLKIRSAFSFLSGAFFQQHRPIRKQRVPRGHAVRWGYLATATAMLHHETGDASLLDTLTAAWDRMVTRRMYVTGGLGSLPVIEGFGRDFEMDNRYAYCETCAALASVFWSREMLLATGEAPYADLIEWQLHNAAAAGIALDGRSYLYRNPLESEGIARKPWFGTACCPGNISRTWASLGGYIFSLRGREIMVHQYIDSVYEPAEPGECGLVRIAIRTELPREGRAVIEMTCVPGSRAVLSLRIPSWSGPPSIVVNGEPWPTGVPPGVRATASGYSPYGSYYARFDREWKRENRIEIELPMEILIRRSDRRVRANRGRVALTRGPLVYCLESVDNPGTRIPGARLDPSRPLTARLREPHFSGACAIVGSGPDGETLTFIPYFSWANRGASSMEVWVKAGAGNG